MAEYFEVFDSSFEGTGIVDVYDELVWERRFYEAGYFELHAPATKNNIELLKTNQVLYKNGSTENGLITAVESSEGDGTASVIAYGRFLSWLLKKHIIKSDMVLSGNAEEIMRQLVYDTVMNPETDDYIAELRLGDKCGALAQMDGFAGYEDLHDALSNIAKQTGVGFRVRFNPENKLLYFECVEGIDRSIEQTANPQVVFSAEYDNILSQANQMINTTPEVNAVTVRYSGQYGELEVYHNPTGASGRNKKEVILTDNPVTYIDSEGVVRMNVPATRSKFLQKAKNAIKAISDEFRCVASTGGYKKEYELGDVVTVFKPEWGVTKNMRLEKVTENTTGAGFEIIPVFGEPFPAE